MNRKAFYLDLGERVVWTFVQAFLGVWIVTADFDMTNLKIAAAAGGVSVAKNLIATQVGNNTAQAIPGASGTYEYTDQ